MEDTMVTGEKVKVKVFGGKTVTRIVVDVIDNTVVICKQSEWKSAMLEGRNPVGVGFPVQSVQQLKQEESASA